MRKTLLLLASGIFTLLLSEGTLQLFNYPADTFSPWVFAKSTGFRLAPNIRQRMTTSEYNIEIQTNESGFRDDPIKGRDGFRILLLGDSFTFGYGVDRGVLFGDILEVRLQTEIINASVPGYELIHQLRWFREEGKNFDPDLVIYALYLGNDLSRNSDWKELPDGTLVSPNRNYPTRNERSIKIRSLLDQLVYTTKFRITQDKEWVPFADYLMMTQVELSEGGKVKYSISKTLLGELYKEVKKNGADFFVIIFPYKTVVDPQAQDRLRTSIQNFDDVYDLDKPSREIEDFLKYANIPYHNLVSPMKQYYKSQGGNPLFFYSDGHFTPAGHAFVASELKPILTPLIQKPIH